MVLRNIDNAFCGLWLTFHEGFNGRLFQPKNAWVENATSFIRTLIRHRKIYRQ